MRGHRPAHRRLDDRVHVAGIEAVARRLGAIHLDIQVRLPQDREDAQVGDAADLAHLIPDLRGQLLQHFEIGTDDLDRIGAFDPRDRLLDVVLDVLGEVEDDSRQLALELRLNLLGQFLLGQALGPLVVRLERHEQFDVRERRGVAAVVGPAMLGNHGNDFRMLQQNQPHFLASPPRRLPARASCGIEARIQKLPSSRCGRNSLPSRSPRKRGHGEKDHADARP